RRAQRLGVRRPSAAFPRGIRARKTGDAGVIGPDFNAEAQRGEAATETECSRPRLQQRAAAGRLVINPAHSGLRMLLRPGTGALRPKSSQPASKLGYCNAKEET